MRSTFSLNWSAAAANNVANIFFGATRTSPTCYVNKIKFSTANEMRIVIHNNYTTLNSTPSPYMYAGIVDIQGRKKGRFIKDKRIYFIA